MEPQPVEKLILPALWASPGLKKLVEGKIFAIKLPERIELPALTYRRISGIPARHLQGYQTELVSMAFDAWALEYGQAKAIALEVQRVMSLDPVKNWFNSDNEGFFENYFRVTVEYTCQQKGGFEK